MSTPQSSRLRIAIAGLRFGAEFAPIYRRHPDVGSVVLCDPNEAALNRTGDTLGITERFTRLEDVLADSTVDAVHVVSPVRFHAEQVLATLNAGKHCACAVPMATREEDIRAILAARRRSGKNYMMMETAVYTREFLYVRDLHARGDLGNLTFLRGAHLQDIEALPDYWKGYPPMLYITHALSPLLALVGARAEVVSCFGSGTLRPDLRAVPGYNQTASERNPFPLQTAHFRLAGTDLAAEITMSFFQNARPYLEAFSVYGDHRSVEWQMQNEEPYLFRLDPLPTEGGRGRPIISERAAPPYRPDLLPPEIADMTLHGGHGGSHPHLVHEFVRSIVEERPPAVDAVTAAHWTGAGITANESSLRGGELLAVPDYGIV